MAPSLVDAKLNAEEPALGRGRDIHIDHAVAHLEVFQDRRSTVEEKALAALIFSRLGLSFQFPARRVRGNGQRLRRLSMDERPEQENAGSEVSRETFPPLLERGRRTLSGSIRPTACKRLATFDSQQPVAYAQWESPLRPTVDFGVRLWTPTTPDDVCVSSGADSVSEEWPFDGHRLVDEQT